MCWKVSFGAQRLSVIRKSTIREQKMYCVYGNSGRYIYLGALFGGGPLLGGSVNGGSTVDVWGYDREFCSSSSSPSSRVTQKPNNIK